MNRDHDLIEDYLDRLLEELKGGGRTIRRMLAEVEDHLREAAAEIRSAGAAEDEAQRVAIERFGLPRLVARRLDLRVELPLLARPAVAALRIAGIALTAVGLSGVLVAMLALLFGPSFAVGDWSAGVPPDYCAELLARYPAAATCPQAAQLDKLANELMFRLVPGAAGLVILGCLWLASRRWPDGRFRLLTTPVAAIFACGSIVVATSLGSLVLDELRMGPGQELGVHLAGVLTAVAVSGGCLGYILRRKALERVTAGIG